MTRPMALLLDHLVVAARNLAQGVAWVEAKLGAPMGPGGVHVTMGTHNALLGLGPGRFLELIAIDPDAPSPGRPRWFELDTPEMQVRLARSPSLIHWAARTDDIALAIAATAAGTPEILALSRGAFRWKIGVPASGSLAQHGIAPTMIEWEGGHPSERLPDVGCRLESLVLRHPQAWATLHGLREAGLPASEPVRAEPGLPGLEALIRTPKGIVALRE